MKTKLKFDHALPIIALTLLSFWGIKALFHPGLFTAHDIWHQVARLYHYYQLVQAGEFPPTWVLSLAHGFGYPLFLFSYHLPWLFALPFLALGLSLPVTIKLLFIASFVFSGLVFYGLSFRLTRSRLAAFVAAAIYLFLPDHLKTILVSAAMGVAWVYVATPLLLWGIWEIYEKPKSLRGLLLTIFGLSSLILSHLMSLIFLGPLLATFILVLWQKSTQKHQFLKQLALALALGLGLSAFYLIPSLYYQQFISARGSSLSQLWQSGLLDWRQIIYSPWGYGIAGNNIKTAALSFQLGFAQWVSIFLAVLILVLAQIKHRVFLSKKLEHLQLLILLLLVFGLSIFMAVEPSRPIWALITQWLPLDFPSRFLFVAVFIASLLSGLVLVNLRRPVSYLVAGALLLIAVYTNRNHLRVNEYTNIPIADYVAAETTTNSFHEYLPQGADITLLSQSNPPLVFAEAANQTKLLEQSANRLSFSLAMQDPGLISFRQFAFPGVQLQINQHPVAYQTDSQGRLQTNLTAGDYLVEIFYQPPLVIRLAQLLTLLSIAGIILLWRQRQRIQK